jgi:uncharacterized protein YjbI with pentapeptide repeats
LLFGRVATAFNPPPLREWRPAVVAFCGAFCEDSACVANVLPCADLDDIDLDDADFDDPDLGAAALAETDLPEEALGEEGLDEEDRGEAGLAEAECEAVLLWADGLAAKQGAIMLRMTTRPVKIPVK